MAGLEDLTWVRWKLEVPRELGHNFASAENINDRFGKLNVESFTRDRTRSGGVHAYVILISSASSYVHYACSVCDKILGGVCICTIPSLMHGCLGECSFFAEDERRS